MLEIPKNRAPWIVAIAAATLIVACGSDKGSEGASPASKGIALAEFCARYDALVCAGNQTCCTDSSHVYSTIDACTAESQCPAVLRDPLVTSGKIAYDPVGAEAFLQKLGESTRACVAPVGEKSNLPLPFLRGTLTAGADCTETKGGLASLACQPGLSCVAGADGKATCVARPPVSLKTNGAACEEEDECASGRCADGLCAERLADGQPCSASSDCANLRCVGADGAATDFCMDGSCKCQKDAKSNFCLNPPTPPSNVTYTLTSLCIWASNASGAGTSHDVVLEGYVGGQDGTWSCTITGGVPQGNASHTNGKCCTPTHGGTGSHSTTDMQVRFKWGYTSGSPSFSDGLKVDAVDMEWKASDGKTGSWGTDLFHSYFPYGVDMNGCNFWSRMCTSFWLDGDGHDNCWKAKIRLSEDTVGDAMTWCNNTGWY
jgi:hypothetical protein